MTTKLTQPIVFIIDIKLYKHIHVLERMMGLRVNYYDMMQG